MTELSPFEQYWRDHQPWLHSRGYQVRPRFRPDWVPSWVTHPVEHNGKLFQREDFLRRRGKAQIMDAIRLSDNKPVMMKRIPSRERKANEEHIICDYISSPEQLQDPDNHCVPIYEILNVPEDCGYVVIIMPLLRRWDNPRFDTFGECLDLFLQIFKGIRYLHRNNIAHRDCTGFNLMMDGSALYPNGFHPVKQDHNRDFEGPAVQKYTQTQRPPRYYWIDFGLSVCSNGSEDPPLARPIWAGDKSAPELQHLFTSLRPYEPINPFPTDIYYLGNMVRMFFLEGSQHFDLSRKFGFDFMKPLIRDMIQDDPAERPTIDECVTRLEEIIRWQSSWALRSQVWHASDNPFGFMYRFFPHWARRIVYIIAQTPAIPSAARQPTIYLSIYAHVILAIWFISPLMVWYFSEFTMVPPSFSSLLNIN